LYRSSDGNTSSSELFLSAEVEEAPGFEGLEGNELSNSPQVTATHLINEEESTANVDIAIDE
jgi:hypothetical protein